MTATTSIDTGNGSEDEESRDAGTPSSDGAPAAPEIRSTHFDFQHKVFRLPGAYFNLDPTSKDPVLNITLGDLRAALPFNTLRESFEIGDDTPDGRLLDHVAKGLRFVKVIRPGEQIPGELLDGKASWSVDDRHRVVARGRLTVQLVSWITGSEMIVVDMEELEQVVEDPSTKQRLKDAFRQIAERLGITANAEQYITDRVDDLAQELSYIEALRDRFRAIRAINDNLVKLLQIYRTDRGFCNELARMQGLIRKPIKEYDAIFDQADAQTGEIFGALKAFDTTIRFIRKIRDELRVRLIEWEEILALWDGLPIEKSGEMEQTQKRTYHFLANRFMEAKVWERK